jgi:glycosyltransferase involved in cell wall biosynthesis
MERVSGRKNLAAFNLINLFYLIKHYANWCITIIIKRPSIAHYPVTSYWNLEKSLLFLATARLLGVKYTIGHLHGGAFIEFWNNLSSFRKRHALKQLKKLDVFIVLSESWKDKIIKCVGIEEQKIKVLHNVIDIEFEDHFKDFHRDYGEKVKITLLGLNLIDSRKGLYDLLEAVTFIKDKSRFELVIIGNEREPGVLANAARMVQEKGLTNILIQGPVWGAEKIKWFEKADVLILPSHVENFPVVVLEAASAGIPVIASKLGALPDLFTHNFDILFVEPKDIVQLNNNIEYLINNQNERKRLGENIKHTFEEKLTRKRVVENLKDIYNNL